MRRESRMDILLARLARIESRSAARWWVTTCCAVTVSAALAQAEQVSFLRPRAFVASGVVRLADIVGTPAGGSAPATSLPEVGLWRAPPACQPMTVTGAEVTARLRQLKLPTVDRAGFSGEVRIESGCQRLERAALVVAATQVLDDWLRVRSDRFERTATAASGVIDLPPGLVSLSARPMPPGLMPATRMQVWVDVAVDGRFVRAIPLVFDVHAFRSAWLAARDLRAGHPLNEVDLFLREIDVAASPGEPVRAVRAKVRLRRALLAGEALTESHTEARPPVEQGSAVVVTSRAGAFAIEARAEALQDGRIGQPVWVRVAASSGPVLARVVAENVVELSRE